MFQIMAEPQSRVAVALSGGVDSAVAGALLLGQGWPLWGVHLRLSAAGPPQEHLAALCRRLGILLSEVDLSLDFARQVLDPFVAEYSRGRTPNPCVRCNATIKFGSLWARVRDQGATHLATGHYARLQQSPQGDLGLYRGVDRHKDQSYFLNRLPRELLSHLLFPLGGVYKSEVRRLYGELGLPQVASCRESQELCFVPGGRYQEFVREQRGWAGVPGELVDTQGRVLGRHRGLEYYTVGQRRGLGVPAREPYYVVELQSETNRVVLGRREELLSPGLLASQANWLIDSPREELEALAVIRYRHPGVPAMVTPYDHGRVRVTFATPQAAVAPGQAVAFYQDERLLGGAWIEERMR